MENEQTSKFLKILAILIVAIATFIVIEHLILHDVFDKTKNEYKEFKLQYEKELEEFYSYKEKLEKELEEKQKKQQEIAERKSNNAKKGNIDINSKFIQDLYDKVIKYEDFGCFGQITFYRQEKTTKDTLTNSEKIMTLLSKFIKKSDEKEEIDFNTLAPDIQTKILSTLVELFKERNKLLSKTTNLDIKPEEIFHLVKFSEEEIHQTAKELFGTYEGIDFINFYDEYCNNNWIYINNEYYHVDWFSGGGPFFSPSATSEIQYAIKEDDYVYIFDKYVYTDYCGEKVTIGGEVYYNRAYENIDQKIPVKFTLEDENYEYTETINNLYDYLYMYKHTFKKDTETGEYYWISTEIVNED